MAKEERKGANAEDASKENAPKRGVRPYVFFTRVFVEQMRLVKDRVGWTFIGAVLATIVGMAAVLWNSQEVILKSNGLLEVCVRHI